MLFVILNSTYSAIADPNDNGALYLGKNIQLT